MDIIMALLCKESRWGKYITIYKLSKFKNGRYWWRHQSHIYNHMWFIRKPDNVTVYLREEKDNVKSFGDFRPFKHEHLYMNLPFTNEELA